MVTGIERNDRPAPGPWGARPEAAPGADRLLAEIPKCPYLAGRPPCGTHHLFPSGTNVCWAEPGGEKPYRAISRETQARHCFSEPEGRSECERYRNAVAGGMPLPQFERRPPASKEVDARFGQLVDGPFGLERDRSPRHRSRRRDGGSGRLLTHAVWLVPFVLTALLLALLLR